MPQDRLTERQPAPPTSPKPQPLGNGVLLFFLLLFILSLLAPRPPAGEEVSYSQFLDRVEAGEVAEIRMSSDRIQYTLSSSEAETADESHLFFTVPVRQDAELVALLRAQNIEFSALPERQSGGLPILLSWILPPVIFIGLWSWIFSRMQRSGPAAMPFAKSKARIYAQGSTGVTFDDVAGIDEAKEELQELVSFLKNAEKYTRLGAKIPKGVLLVGPPGTGKTLLARAIAGEAGVPFFSISGSEFIELFVGVGASRVRDLFEQAQAQAPCIVFIDELDALGKSRATPGNPMGGGHDEREQTLNQLLSELDGFIPNSGVILLAATNRPEVLDPALLRPGRFNRQVLVDRPDRAGREAILAVHAREVRLAAEVNLAKLAAITPGFAGADLANLVNEAALLAARKEREQVTEADFKEAIERVLAGLEKKSRILSETEQKIVAYHEVGHAIVGKVMPGLGTIEKISVVPRGAAALGYTLQLPEHDRFLVREDEIRGRIATLLAGRAAEDLTFQKTSTGASDDIQKATDLAERSITLHGMSKKLGPVAYERVQHQHLEGYYSPRREVSQKVAELIDREVSELVDSAYRMAKSILSLNQSVLSETAETLVMREVLEGEDLTACLDRVQVPSLLPQWLCTGQLSLERDPKISLQAVRSNGIF